ncbi:MAG: hypothetical protein AB1505_30610 [Candidatus Latescibacterota bacterium]
MSLCPFGMEAERHLIPALEAFGERLELQVHYIADEAAPGATTPSMPSLLGGESAPSAPAPPRRGCAGSRAAASGEGPFRSLHGQEEVSEGRRQVVLQEGHPGAYRAYLLCRSRQGVTGDWRECARAVGVDPDTLQARAQGPQGEKLFRASIRRAAGRNIHLSPTLLVNGQEYDGELAGFALTRRLCREVSRDPACQHVPACGADADCQAAPGMVSLCQEPDTPQARCLERPVVPFTLTVLEAASCASCSTASFLRTTADLFPGARVQVQRSDSPEGAALARAHGVQAFPAYLFSPQFAGSPRFERVRSMLTPRGDSFLVVPRIAQVTYWPDRQRRGGCVDLFVPAADPAPASRFLDGWKTGEGDTLQVHPLPPAGQAGAAANPPPEEWQRLACLGAQQPETYGAYLRARSRLRAQGEDAWEDWARAAAADPVALGQCVASGRGARLLEEARDTADSLELEGDTVSALLDNRLLVRRAQPLQLPTIALEGRRP